MVIGGLASRDPQRKSDLVKASHLLGDEPSQKGPDHIPLHNSTMGLVAMGRSRMRHELGGLL